MSLDVSPDGQTIVFDLLGDLYTMPIAGGTATRITKGMAFDAQPNVWTLRMDFTDTTQVTRGNNSGYVSPEWMPNGEHILVSRSTSMFGAAKVVMYPADGGSPFPVVGGSPAFKSIGASPSPDGQHIWYAGRTGDWQYNAIFPQYQLYRFDREVGTSTQMTARYGSGFRPAISPDGNWLVYGTRENTQTGLRKRNLATGDEEWLVYAIQRDDMEARSTLDVIPGYSFTPDSRRIVISYGGKMWSVPMDGAAPSEIPFEADVDLAVGPEVRFAYQVDSSALVTARQIRHPVTSPDGSQLLFTAFDRVWIKDMPTGEATRVSDEEIGQYHAVWSPDGSAVAYVTWDDSAGGHIMRANADGSGQPQQLTSAAALYYNLAWSPDGERVVATRGAARELKKAPDVFFGPLGGEFVWVPANGGDVSLIAPTGSRNVAHFRTDQPNRIYAYSRAEGLVSFRWDGTDVKRHLVVRGTLAPGARSPHEEKWEQLPRHVFPVPVEPPSAGALEARQPPPAGLVMISPTGDRAVAQVGNHIYTVDLFQVGPAPLTVSVGGGAPVKVRKLTEIGGEFPSWSADGERVNWGIGNALFTYDLERVEAVEDSIIQDARDKVGQALIVRGILDSLKATRALIDSVKKADSTEVVADSMTTKLNGLIADSVQIGADSLMREAEKARARADAIRFRADSVRAGLDTVTVDSVGYKPDEMRIKVTMPRDVPRGTVVLRGARVITMQDDTAKAIIDSADVVIVDNRIVAVGVTGEVEVPDSAEVIDVTGKTIIPGFVDTHYHAQWLVPEIHVGQVWQYLTNLAFGVTTTRDPQTNSTDLLSYQDRVAIGGMLGPRIYSTGPGVFWTEGIRDADHAKNVLKRYSEYYDTKTLKMYMSGNRQQRQWIIGAAKELELMPTTEGGLDYKLDLTHAIDIDGYSGIEHALPVTPLYQDVVELFKASQTTNSPTLLVSYGGPFGENYFYTHENVHGDAKLRHFAPHASVDARTRRRGPGAGGSPGRAGWFLEEEYVFSKHAEFIGKLLADSARAAVGSHGQLQGLGYHWELWALGSGGVDNHDVLRAATILGAEAIGFGSDLGSIEEGKLADILVLDQNPLDDLRNTRSLRYVMKNGRLYDADTLDEVWPRQRSLPVQPWADQEPDGVSAGIR